MRVILIGVSLKLYARAQVRRDNGMSVLQTVGCAMLVTARTAANLLAGAAASAKAYSRHSCAGAPAARRQRPRAGQPETFVSQIAET